MGISYKKTVEEWRKIMDFPDYEVSDLGRVRRKTITTRITKNNVVVSASGLGRTYAGRILKPSLRKSGYLRVTLHNKGKKIFIGISHLVAEAFLGDKPTRYHQINHIDGIKINNRWNNLEYVTDKENKEHAIKLGLNPYAIKGCPPNCLRKKVYNWPV